MAETEKESILERVLIMAPYGRDAELFETVLSRAGIQTSICRTLEGLAESISEGAAAAIVADEALNQSNVPVLAAVLGQQPAWSDFPVLLLTGGGEVTDASRYRLQMFAPLGNVTLIERPLRTATLLSTVHTAIRARKRQYQIRDQFERQRALSATLRDNEEKLKFALDAARLGSWELRMPQRELVASVQCNRNFGFPEHEQFTYERLFELIHPEDRERVQGEIARAFAGQTNFHSEYRIVRPDGTRGWIFAAGRPIYGAEGRPSQMIGVTLDITTRRKGDEAIRESESQLRALADSIPQMAWMAEPDGARFWYNRRWYEYTGTTLDQVKGWGWKTVHDPQMLPEVLARWKTTLDTASPFEMEFPLRGADGAFRWFLTQARPVFNLAGEVVRWFGTNTDIDDKKQAEKALRESEELARSVIQNYPDCVEVLDPHGRTVLVNAKGARLHGLEPLGLHCEWVDSWEGEARKRAQASVAEALAGHESQFQASSDAANGEIRWWDVTVSPIVSDDSKVSRLLCISRDVTLRRKAEEEMRETAKLESLGVMAGGIAHDFNNLLTGILGNASLLQESVPEVDRRFAEDIVLAAERAADLTRQMLAYSGKGRMTTTRVDVSALVREMLRLVRPAMDKNIEIEVDLCERGCTLEGDASQIQQVIMNLLLNAGEAMEGRPGRVTVRTARAAECVRLEVEDNGSGMDEATKAKIFDPFFTTKFTGRGLGLAAVMGIVRGHHGSLKVESAVGRGTTFTVLFPAAAGDASPVSKTRRVGRGDNRVILLVDDEEMVQRFGVTALERAGYRVCVVDNGRDAVEIYGRIHRDLDLVLLDLAMPVMSGEEALRRMHQMDASVPVIVCSGFDERQVARRFSNQWVSGYLQKPYSASRLLECVQGVLTGVRPR